MVSRKQRIARRKFLGTGLKAGAAAGTGWAGWRLIRWLSRGHAERRKAAIDSAERFLARNNFGGARKREWAHILDAFIRKGISPEAGLGHLRTINTVLAGTAGLTPIDVVRTIRENPPTKKHAELIRRGIREDHPKEEVKRRANIARICETMEGLGVAGRELNNAVNSVSRNELDGIIRARKKNRL